MADVTSGQSLPRLASDTFGDLRIHDPCRPPVEAARTDARVDVFATSVWRLDSPHPPGCRDGETPARRPALSIPSGSDGAGLGGGHGPPATCGGLAVLTPHSRDVVVSAATTRGCRAANSRQGSRSAIRRHRPGATARTILADRLGLRRFSFTTSDSSAVGQGEAVDDPVER